MSLPSPVEPLRATFLKGPRGRGRVRQAHLAGVHILVRRLAVNNEVNLGVRQGMGEGFVAVMAKVAERPGCRLLGNVAARPGLSFLAVPW